MNTQLVESLVQAVLSLSLEEQKLFERSLKPKNNWQENYQKLKELRAEIFARRGGKPFNPSLDSYIQEARDERTAIHDEWIRDAFAERNKA
jgi:hypothetical protein